MQNITPKQNWLAFKLYSTHPDDAHLRVVIRPYPRIGTESAGGYVVHTYNAQQDGYSNGDYCNTWQEAIEHFNKRGSNR